MEHDKDTQQKISQLQILEQNIQNVLMQKQAFQQQIVELDNALDEVDKSKGAVYKIVGNIMVNSDKESIKKDLTSKKDIVSLRIKSVDKQEQQLKEKASALQVGVLSKINKEK